MDYRKINPSEVNALWDLQKQYKAEIGEDEPGDDGKERLADAIDKGMISFYGVWKDNTLIGCCSITVGFSTFDVLPPHTRDFSRELGGRAFYLQGLNSYGIN